MSNKFTIEPIQFNGYIFNEVELTDSATKHFQADSEKYYRYVIQYLDGQHWKETEKGDDGQPLYMTASVTTSIKGLFAESDYRETYFKICPEIKKLLFFHGCSIKEKQYKKSEHKMNLQFE